MKLSREAKRQSRELFDLAMVDGRLDKVRLRQIFDEVAQKKPRFYLEILKELTRLARLEIARHHAIIESATSLDSTRSQELEKTLRNRFGDITTEFRHNPALIAGIRIQMGSDVWDGSVVGRLETLKQEL